MVKEQKKGISVELVISKKIETRFTNVLLHPNTTMASMINDFALKSANKNKKFNFKTTVVRRNGIEVARPAPKIPRTSRDSVFKVARSKARSAIRNCKDQTEDTEQEYEDTAEAKPSITDYFDYYAYEVAYNGSCELSYAQYCAYYAPQVTYALPYFPPKVSADTTGSHWPRPGVYKSYADLLK